MNPSALSLILAAPEAWVTQDTLEAAGVPVAELEGLEAEGLLVRWPLPKGLAWTLTPWGVWVADTRIVEKPVRGPLRAVKRKREHPQLGKLKYVRDTALDTPHFAEGRFDMESDGRDLPQVKIPRHAHECPLDFPELVPDPLPGPEFLEDEEGEPVRLFGERAVTVRIDKRIKGKRAKTTKAKRRTA